MSRGMARTPPPSPCNPISANAVRNAKAVFVLRNSRPADELEYGESAPCVVRAFRPF